MSVLTNRTLVVENLNDLLALRDANAVIWQSTNYDALIEAIWKDTTAVAHIDTNVWFGLLQKSALITSFLLSQQAKAVDTVPVETLQIYYKLALETGKINYPQSAPRFVFPQIDSKPIDVADEPETKSADKAELETIFNGLVKKWKEETGGYSLTSQKYAHPAYQSILVLGSEVVPFILRDLQTNGGRWFEALKALTKRDDITKPSDSYEDAVKAWIAWGKDNKLI